MTIKRTRNEAQGSRKLFASAASTGALAAAALGGALVTAAVLSAGFARSTISADTFRQLDLFGEVFEQVYENYVEKPEDAKLVKGAIDGMLSELDPHSSYMTAEDFTRMQEQTRGSFAGLGIQVVMDNEGPDQGFVKVIAPIDDTPAQKAGIQPQDLITEIDGAEVFGMTIDEAIEKLKGAKGTPVEIAVVRDRTKPSFKLKLVRDIVRVPAVTHRVEGNFGYIRVTNFSEQTEDGLLKALKSFDKSIPGGAKGYVLDLRNNPGGLLDQAVAVSDAFLEGGEIVSTRGRNPKDTLREMGTSGDLAKGKPIVVMINGGSASASEIVAGALQDRNRALILGTQSFGKGSVQTVIPLQNGLQGALRLTTARYYTPSGRSIQAHGIDPDIVMPVTYPGQEEPAGERPTEASLPGALDVKKDEKAAKAAEKPAVAPFMCHFEKGADGKPNETDPHDCQLDRALSMLADTTAYRSALADATASRRSAAQ
ncbi:MAG TPA: peptidase S41 [Parvularcula sp.]|nr:peptidase S41 [Parvularcula sp.]